MKINKYQWGSYSPMLSENVSKSSKQTASNVTSAAQLVRLPRWNTEAYTYKEPLNQKNDLTSSNRRKTADAFDLSNFSKNNNKIVKDLEPAGPIYYSTTPFNRYQSLKSPVTGNPIEVKTDNTLWSWYRGKNPWKYINGGTRYRMGPNGWEIQKFDGGGGYMDYSDPSDVDYWTNYIEKLEKVLPSVPKKNIFGIPKKNKQGGYLKKINNKLIEVPFNDSNVL